MAKYENYVYLLRNNLKKFSSAEKAKSTRRFFPSGINCIGVTSKDIQLTISHFHSEHSQLSADQMLSLSEAVLENAVYAEEILIAYGLIYKLVKNNYDDNLLMRFRDWLENYASNWAHVDDLCIKTAFQYLMARPHLIEKTQLWSTSNTSWCRRASNVVWVKFVRRKIGSTVYCLDKRLIFKNCDRLIQDQDEFVQKSVGWLLKVSSQYYQKEVIQYIKNNQDVMQRSTIRYALEKIIKNPVALQQPGFCKLILL